MLTASRILAVAAALAAFGSASAADWPDQESSREQIECDASRTDYEAQADLVREAARQLTECAMRDPVVDACEREFQAVAELRNKLQAAAEDADTQCDLARQGF